MAAENGIPNHYQVPGIPSFACTTCSAPIARVSDMQTHSKVTVILSLPSSLLPSLPLETGLIVTVYLLMVLDETGGPKSLQVRVLWNHKWVYLSSIQALSFWFCYYSIFLNLGKIRLIEWISDVPVYIGIREYRLFFFTCESGMYIYAATMCGMVINIGWIHPALHAKSIAKDVMPTWVFIS